MPRSLVLVCSLILTVMLISRSAGAQYQQLDYPATVPLQNTNWSTSMIVPAFDPGLGQLVRAEIRLTGRTAGTARVECLDIVPASVTTTLATQITLTRPDLTVLLTSLPQANFIDNLTAFDGTIDFAGTSGATHSGVNILDAPPVLSSMDPSLLLVLTGASGNPGTVGLPIFATGMSTATGSGNLITQFVVQAAAEVVISYFYDPSIALRLQKRSTRPVPGRIVDSFLTVRNSGFLSSVNLEVLESVDPRYFQLLDVEPAGVVGATALSALGLVAWRVPTLAPGQTVILRYTARLHPDVQLGTVLPTGPAWAGHDLVAAWLQCSEVIQATNSDCACAVGACIATCSANPDECLACRASELAQLCPQQGQLCLRASRDLVVTCFDATADIAGRFSELTTVVGPLDPNEKQVINTHYVQPTESLTYAIHYENIGTLAAQDIVITDVLHQHLNPATLQMFPPATYSAATRTISWNLQGINLAPGETGNVLMIASPNPGLPPGTVVSNQAGIQFEAQPPIQTNIVVNRIDGVRPNGMMFPLPTASPSEEFVLSWSGTDAVGVTLDYSIYVSRNGTQYQPLLIDTTTTTTTFTGQAGSRYDFYCVARDSAGNIEAQTSAVEASTTISSLGTSLCAGDGGSTTCPCGNASQLGAGEGCLNSIGTGGKLVTTGTSSISQADLILVGTRMPNCPVLYFQGTAIVNGGQGTVFGDGLRCAAGVVVRLATKVNVVGASQFPGVDDLPVAVRGLVQPGSQRVYQCWYRNSADFCTPELFNLTNARRVTWEL